MIEVRRATLDDAQAVYPILKEYYDQDREDVDMDDDETAEYVIALLSHPNCVTLVSEVDGEIGGIATLSTTPVMGRVLAKEVLWKIDEKYTKTKIGAKLLTSLDEEAVAAGADAITLVALAGPHDKRVGNSYVSKGFTPLAHTYIKDLR